MHLPDLYAHARSSNQTFWSHLLTGNPDGCAHEEVLRHIEDCAEFMEEPLIVGGVRCHQVLAYAARSFATVVMNTAWVPLISRLGKLSKLIVALNDSVRVSDDHSLTGYWLLVGVQQPDDADRRMAAVGGGVQDYGAPNVASESGRPSVQRLREARDIHYTLATVISGGVLVLQPMDARHTEKHGSSHGDVVVEVGYERVAPV
eukprot:363578-Chlamydomonas_euryale.AAC.8